MVIDCFRSRLYNKFHLDDLANDWVHTSTNIMDALPNSFRCWQKNRLVCKSCTMTDTTGVTVNKRYGSFQAYCFDEGHVVNTVSPWLSYPMAVGRLSWRP